MEGGYVVGVDLSSERSDEWTLLNLLERMDAGLGQRHEAVVADAGYESEENYTGSSSAARSRTSSPRTTKNPRGAPIRTTRICGSTCPMTPRARALRFAVGMSCFYGQCLFRA